MATQKSTFSHPIGTYNGINYYYLNGKLVTRKAGGGFNSEFIKKSPKGENIRKSNTEFANCSRDLKAFKQALFPFTAHITDRTLHSRLMQLFLKIKEYDASVAKGERRFGKGLQTPMGQHLFREFRFTPKCSLFSGLFRQSSLEIDKGLLELTYVSPEYLIWNKGATHYLLQFGILYYTAKTDSFQLQPAPPILIQKDDPARDVIMEVDAIIAGSTLQFGVLMLKPMQFVVDRFCDMSDARSNGLMVV